MEDIESYLYITMHINMSKHLRKILCLLIYLLPNCNQFQFKWNWYVCFVQTCSLLLEFWLLREKGSLSEYHWRWAILVYGTIQKWFWDNYQENWKKDIWSESLHSNWWKINLSGWYLIKYKQIHTFSLVIIIVTI